jgi:heme exporter protein CcmD
MGYVIAAYGVTVVALVGYAIQLLRERRRLARAAVRADRSAGTGKAPG